MATAPTETTVPIGIENNNLLNSLFVYEDVQVNVSLNTLRKFVLIETMMTDLNSTEIPHIPILYDAMGNHIQFSTGELQLFIDLFELCHNIVKTEDNLFQAISDSNISSNVIKKFIILINLLDNIKFLNSLCKYIAKLIRNGQVNC